MSIVLVNTKKERRSIMGQEGKPSFIREYQINKCGMNPRNGKLLFYILNRITVSGKDHGPQGVKDVGEQTVRLVPSISLHFNY